MSLSLVTSLEGTMVLNCWTCWTLVYTILTYVSLWSRWERAVWRARELTYLASRQTEVGPASRGGRRWWMSWVTLHDGGGEWFWAVVCWIFWEQGQWWSLNLETCGDYRLEQWHVENVCEDICQLICTHLKSLARDAIRSRCLYVLIRLNDLHTSALDITGGQGSWVFCTSSAGELLSNRYV